MEDSEVIKSIFPHEGIYESIMGTKGDKGYNLSPIGIIVRNNLLTSKIYKNTVSYSNILKYPSCSINILNDPEVFYYSLVGEKLNYKVRYDLPTIGSLSLFARCDIIEDQQSFVIVKLNIFDFSYEPSIPRAFSRGDSLFIDLLVHLTRLDILSGKDLEDIRKIISYEMKTIKRLSPNLTYLLDKIETYISSKGFKLE